MAKDKRIVEVGLPKEREHKFACAQCGCETFHEVLTGVSEVGEFDEFQFRGEYWTIQCKGCKSVSFCHRSTNSEDFDYDDTGHMVSAITVQLYPSRVAGRKEAEWIFELPRRIYRIYRETHSAICNNELILAGIGMRAIIEAVCTDAGLAKGSLQSKIDDLKEAGAVTANGARVLHRLRFMGNAAAHETKVHTISELGTAFEVVENILFNCLILPLRAAKLPTD